MILLKIDGHLFSSMSKNVDKVPFIPIDYTKKRNKTKTGNRHSFDQKRQKPTHTHTECIIVVHMSTDGDDTRNEKNQNMPHEQTE